MKVGLVSDPVYLKHDTGQHIENASRLEAITSHLEQTGLVRQLTPIKPRSATTDELSLVHSENHISSIQATAKRSGGWLDADTVMSAGSYEAALYAAGGVIKATAAVLNSEVSSAFALVRPPGHHATPRQAMGFCLFNNVAIAAKYALTEFNLERILIIDFDIHHGNGTQETFYDNPQVFYISTHLYPYYPGTGRAEETGNGSAKGTTLNIPMPAGCGDTEYQQVFESVVVPAAQRFNPRLILVSAGYDAHWADGLTMMQISVTGFAGMVRIIAGLAGELCDGRMVFGLEGGYDLAALSSSVQATLDLLLGNTKIEDPLGMPSRRFTPPDISPLLATIREIHGLN